jgi:hypothetical protein
VNADAAADKVDEGREGYCGAGEFVFEMPLRGSGRMGRASSSSTGACSGAKRAGAIAGDVTDVDVKGEPLALAGENAGALTASMSLRLARRPSAGVDLGRGGGTIDPELPVRSSPLPMVPSWSDTSGLSGLVSEMDERRRTRVAMGDGGSRRVVGGYGD